MSIGLTPRERQVMQLLAQGGTYKEIGKSLGISHLTVKNYVSSSIRYYNVNGARAAIWAGMRAGDIEPPRNRVHKLFDSEPVTLKRAAR